MKKQKTENKKIWKRKVGPYGIGFLIQKQFRYVNLKNKLLHQMYILIKREREREKKKITTLTKVIIIAMLNSWCKI